MSELMSQMSAALRARHHSRRTEQAYRLCVRRFIRFHGIRHAVDMAEPEINAFVTHPAVDEQVSASTQTQALSAILFLHRHVIGREVGELTGLVRARTPGACASSTSRAARSSCATAKAARTASRCCRARSRPPPESQPAAARAIHERDLADSWGRVALPDALARKYPNAPADWRRQWMFPQRSRWRGTNRPTSSST